MFFWLLVVFFLQLQIHGFLFSTGGRYFCSAASLGDFIMQNELYGYLKLDWVYPLHWHLIHELGCLKWTSSTKIPSGQNRAVISKYAKQSA